MSDGKRPTKGTLRLAPRADKPAGTAKAGAKAQSAKSGVRRVAAAAARGERMLPAAPVAGSEDGERGRRPGKAVAGGRGDAPSRGGARAPEAKRGPGGPRKPAGEWGGDRRPQGRADSPVDGRSEFRGKPRPADAGSRGGPDAGAGRGGERRTGRMAAAGDTPWGGARAAGGDKDSRQRPVAGRERAPAVSEADADGMDVWAQARANLAARARQPATERAPRREQKFPAKAQEGSAAKWAPKLPNVSADASTSRSAEKSAGEGAAKGSLGLGAAGETPVARPTPDHPLYDASGVRVSKLLADQGLCSRREADAYIERGWVLVDGQRVNELGLRVSATARVTLAPEAHATQTQQATILLHKPVGFVSGQPEPGYEPAVNLIGPANQIREADEPLFHAGMLKGLAPAGRLDIDSTGLLVLTQDGRVARQLIGDKTKIDKEYIVRVEGALIDNGLALLNHGLSLDDKPLRPAHVEWINDDQLRFVLREGRKRQIRRMCELVGLHVVGLKRVRIGQVRLGDLPLGSWRLLRPGETF